MKFIKNKEDGFWELISSDGNTLAQVVPWTTGGYAVFIYGKLVVVQKKLARAKQFAKACV